MVLLEGRLRIPWLIPGDGVPRTQAKVVRSGTTHPHVLLKAKPWLTSSAVQKAQRPPCETSTDRVLFLAWDGALGRSPLCLGWSQLEGLSQICSSESSGSDVIGLAAGRGIVR